MSFASDSAALSALVSAIKDRGYYVSVFSEGDRLLAASRSFLSISVAVQSVTDDCVLLLIAEDGKRAGFFRVLLQDDPDCLIVDHSDNALCNEIFDQWFAIAEAF